MKNDMENPATRANACRAPNVLIFADSAPEFIPTALTYQAKILARRYGLATGIAELVAALLFQMGEAK